MKKTIALIAGLIVLLSGASAQNPKSQPAATANKSAFEQAAGDPLNARIYTLKNGMKVYLSVYRNAPRIQTYIAVRAGSKNDPADATGLAHYLEHMLFKGTDKFGTKNFAKENAEITKIEALYEKYRKTTDVAARKRIYHEIDSVSGVAARFAIANEYDKMLASIGADGTNAFTSFDQTVYVNDIPSNQVGNWLKIEAERFRNPVLRLFHTELEAVYEEKNRGLDNDDSKIWEAVFAGLFRNHTYGTQTTIGTIEHLKNPSLTEIKKYYHKHYVPNNMAIIMSGDFDPEMVIAEIRRNFESYKSVPVEPYKFTPESPITKKIELDVFGPTPANVNLAWRCAGEGTPDSDAGMLMSGILYNKTAGLMDLNLNQAQKVLNSSDFYYPLKDYGIFVMSAEPKEGQSLKEAEELLLSQLDLVRKGDFPDWLVGAVQTDLKLKLTKEFENNSSRADAMLTAFVNDLKWQEYVNRMDRISRLTKQDVVAFANKTFSRENCVVVYKKTGVDSSIQKVEKPAITPVDLDRENASPFVKMIEKSAPKNIQPKFINYDTDVKKAALKTGVPLLYSKNSENKLFEMYYKFEMGSNNNKLLPLAIKYIPYLSTSEMSAAQVQQEFYKLGCAFNVFCDEENVWINLSGLSDNFEYATKQFEKLLANPVVEESVLRNLVSDVIKERNDNKLQKRLILGKAMTNYARYGALNPFSNVLSDEELAKLTPAMISDCIKSLESFEHNVLYYGPREVDEVRSYLDSYHRTPAKLQPVPAPVKFEEKQMEKTVYVVDYDMKQVEIVMLSNGMSYDPKTVPIIYMYNNYFGGGMSSVLFQDLRESKALAYSTFSRYWEPNRLHKKYYNYSYIGSQSDKLGEALSGLSGLLNEMPRSEGSFTAAKEMILQEMRTQRITRADILFNYLVAERMGLKSDIRKDIFTKVQTYTFADVSNFHKENIRNKPTTVLVLGKKDLLDMKTLEQYGTVKFLTLSEVFGY